MESNDVVPEAIFSAPGAVLLMLRPHIDRS